MSERELRAALETMEAWVSDSGWVPEPEALIQWNASLQLALAKIEKGPDWPELQGRAHVLGREVERRMTAFMQLRDAVRVKLDAQGQGQRALMGYGASSR